MKAPSHILVIGAGIYGSTLADHLSAMNHKVTLVDDGGAQHHKNASSGETRLFRRTIVEDSAYISFADQSLKYIRELASETTAPLSSSTGFAFVAFPGTRIQRHHSTSNIVRLAGRIAQDNKIQHELLTGSHLQSRFPTLQLSPSASVFYEPGALTLHVDKISQTIIQRLRARGVRMLLANRVQSVRSRAGAVTALLESGEILHADFAVVCTGSGPLEMERQSLVIQQPTHWYEAETKESYPALVITRPNAPLLFGFPRLAETLGAKFVHENAVPNRVKATQSPSSPWEAKLEGTLGDAVRGIVPGIGRHLSTKWSPYVVMPGARMVVRRHGAEVLRVSCCSGHGYKLAAGITKRIAENIHAGSISNCLME